MLNRLSIGNIKMDLACFIYLILIPIKSKISVPILAHIIMDGGKIRHQPLLLGEHGARLLAGVVGLVEGLGDPIAPLVDQPLDAAEGELLEHEEDDGEGDDRPDHQAWDDLDQVVPPALLREVAPGSIARPAQHHGRNERDEESQWEDSGARDDEEGLSSAEGRGFKSRHVG